MFGALNRSQMTLVLAGLAGLALLPLVVTGTYFQHILILCMLFAGFTTAWNLSTGFAGMKTFGHHAFFGVGAYASALIAMHTGLSPWLTIWLGGALAALSGLLIALPVLRIRSVPHIAIITLAYAEIVRILLSNFDEITRGELGLWGIPAFEGFALPLLGEVAFGANDKVGYYYVALALMAGIVGGTVWLIRSRTGLALVAMRDGADAAESLGVDLVRHKMLTFGISAFMVGVCGAFYAHYLLILTPHAVVGIDLMVLIVAMTLVGGLGTFTGPVLGAFLLTLLVESLRVVGDYRILVYGALIMVTMIFLPRGLAPYLLDLLPGRLVRGARHPPVAREPETARDAV
ncbi:MAG: branched-chain amino acid ABC transporter permease [Pseudomonadota bacterium]